jgi:hypothetical protein
LPDPDAERIEKAVSALEDLVIDWPNSFETIAGELSGLITVNDMVQPLVRSRTPRAGWGVAGTKAMKAWWGPEGAKPIRDRPRDVLMVAGLRTAALVTMHAVKGTRPDWIEESPHPLPTPAVKGPNAMVLGKCEGKNRYSLGASCPLRWSPSPLSIVSSRAEYVAWHHGLTLLALTLHTEKFEALPPKASQTPWLHGDEPVARIKPVMPVPGNDVSAWGTLPLAPQRDRKAAPIQTRKAGPVRYPLRELCS